MSTEDFLDESQLRAVLKLDAAAKQRTWRRIRPYFAPALLTLPTGFGAKGHRLYDVAKVRELLAARRETNTPLSRARSLRRIG